MHKPLQLIQPNSLLHFRRVIWPELVAVSQDRTLEALVPFDSLSGQYQVSDVILWDCLLALRFEPQDVNGQPYFTVGQVKRLEQFIKRIEITWACLKIF